MNSLTPSYPAKTIRCAILNCGAAAIADDVASRLNSTPSYHHVLTTFFIVYRIQDTEAGLDGQGDVGDRRSFRFDDHSLGLGLFQNFRAGIDKETAKALLEHNAKVYIGARDAAKARMAIDDFRSTTRKEAHSLKVHLADLNSVKAAAEQFTSHETHLHILYNNAFVESPMIPS